jgi:uncharacterized protein (TIGR03000 family)
MYSLVLLAALTTGEQTPDFFLRGHGCHGCYGCYGYYASCYGACYGYGYGGWGCHGYGGWGAPYGCYGSACYGGWGAPGWACYGCCGGYASMAYAPGPVGIMPPAGEPGPMTGTKKKGPEPDGGEASSASRARLIVELPAGAQLYVDDKPVAAAGRKAFRTPELRPGASYYYEVRAEVMRDGQRVSETRRVVIRAGQVAREDFRSLGTAVSTANAR